RSTHGALRAGKSGGGNWTIEAGYSFFSPPIVGYGFSNLFRRFGTIERRARSTASGCGRRDRSTRYPVTGAGDHVKRSGRGSSQRAGLRGLRDSDRRAERSRSREGSGSSTHKEGPAGLPGGSAPRRTGRALQGAAGPVQLTRRCAESSRDPRERARREGLGDEECRGKTLMGTATENRP